MESLLRAMYGIFISSTLTSGLQDVIQNIKALKCDGQFKLLTKKQPSRWEYVTGISFSVCDLLARSQYDFSIRLLF
jgi:hypothetical protein